MISDGAIPGAMSGSTEDVVTTHYAEEGRERKFVGGGTTSQVF